MTHIIQNRRDFLIRAAAATVAVFFLIGCRSTTSFAGEPEPDILSLIKRNANTAPEVNWCGAIDAPANVYWTTELSKKSTTDEALTVTGTVFKADGKPAPNILIYFYHTDVTGYYGRGNGEVRHGHFRGWMLTGDNGKYAFKSIKPDPYPNRTEAAHIHMTLTSVDRREDSIDVILFEGDKFITQREREMASKKGGFQPILKLEKGQDGVLRGVRDIQL